jgi:Outer membrane protein beta-barrel family
MTDFYYIKKLFTFKLLVFCATLFSMTEAAAQNFNLKGHIVDNKNDPLSGEILVLSEKDLSLIKGSIFTEGVVEIADIPSKDIMVRVSSLGFADTLLHIKPIVVNLFWDLGTLVLTQHNQLKEVTVTAKVPLFKKIEGGTVINVESTMLASSVTSMEVLSKSPGVSIAGNRVNVFGRGEAVIYLNGKQIAYERLASIPVSLIKEIEIITNPSAKYDARGRAVINIVTKRNEKEGIQCVVSQSLTQGKHLMPSSTLNLNYRKNKLSLSGDYGLNLGTDWNTNIQTTFFKTGREQSNTISHYEENTRQNVSNYKIGLAYDINNKSDFSIQYDGLSSVYNLGINNKSENYNGPASTFTTINVFNNGSTKNRNNSVNTNYNLKLDTLGSTLFIGGQYNRFYTHLYDQIHEEASTNGQTPTKALRVNDGRNQIDLYTAQLDWSKTLKKGGKFEGGAKFYHITNDGKAAIRSQQDGSEVWTDFSQFANSFNYQEDVPAVYGQFMGNINPKLSYAIGSRGEQSNVTGFSGKLNKLVIDTTYFNLFPNAKLSYKISDNWSWTVSYAKRINRPIYQNIDPFVWYIDSLTSVQGNSRLIPELINSFEGVISFKNFSLRLGHSSSKNAMSFAVLQGNTGPNSLIFTTINMQQLKQYNAALDLPFETKIWSSSNTIAVNFNKFIDNRPEFTFSTSTPQPQLYVYTYQQINIPNLFTFDVTGEYYGKKNDGLRTLYPIYYMTFGISKAFLDKKLNCRLIYNDAFRTQRVEGERTIGYITTHFNQRYNTHYLRLSASYKFGYLKEANYKNKAVNEAEFNRIKQ